MVPARDKKPIGLAILLMGLVAVFIVRILYKQLGVLNCVTFGRQPRIVRS